MATSAFAAPAVFFNDDTVAGLQTFADTVAAADAAYNAANPGSTQQSTIFAIDLNNSTGSSFSVTSNGETVYVVTTRAGMPAPNNTNGDENSLGFTQWSVNYPRGDFNSAIAQGYNIAFYSDAALTTPFSVNAAGLFVSNWGTCCTTNNTTPDGSTADASEIYMLFNGSTPLRVGGITSAIGGEEHFVAAIDDSNSFTSVNLVPNGIGEVFGAGGYLVFSNVQIGSVPAGSSVVTVGTPPDINAAFTVVQLQNSQVNPVFDGGTLTADADATLSTNMSIKGTGGTIDTDGHDLALNGVLSDAAGDAGNITKSGAGTLTLGGVNSYSGATTISDGTLALAGDGSIATSSGVVANGTFDIAGTNSGASVRSLSGNGGVALGARTLTITDATGTFDGAINGSGGLAVTGGTLALTGTNGFSGATTISDGTLALSGNGSVAASSGVVANGTFDIAGTNSGASVRSLSGNGAVALGARTLTITDAAGTFDGAINGTGGLAVTGGTLALTGNNGFSGATTISDGTLALSGDGSIAASSGVVANGTFDISATNAGASVRTISGNGAVALGARTLTITDAAGTFDGAINGTGGLAVTGGTLALTGNNDFSGGFLIDDAIVSASGAGNLGTGAVTIANGALRATGGFTASNAFVLTDDDSTIDTGTHAVTLSGGISGNGVLNKSGRGVLTLSGANDQRATVIHGGSLIAASAQALGAADGDLYIGADSSFAAGSSMSISQNVHIGGNNAVFDTGANDVTLTGSADGLHCLIKEGTGRLTLAAAAANAIGACVNNGTLSFNNVFTGNVWVQESGTASGVGAINGDIEVRGRLAPGNSPGQLVVAGSVTQMAGSTFSVDIDGLTAGNGAGHFDTLVLVGANSVYTAAGTIEPVLRGITGDATNSFNPEIGARFQVVTAEGGVVGTYDDIVQPAAGLPANSRFDVFYNPNSIVLYVTPNEYRTMFGAGTMLNAAAAGGAVDAFRTDAGTVNSGATGTLLDGLYPLGEGGIGRALEQTSGAIYANVMDSVVQATRFAHGAVSDRLNAEVDGIDADAPLASRVWGLMSRDTTHVDADAHGQGYRGNNFTMVIGADRMAGSRALLGAAFAYNRNKTGTGYIGNGSADSYHGIVYGRINASNWYTNGLFSFGVDRYDVSRSVELATGEQTARGKGDGVSFGADAEAGYKLRFGKALLTPALGISYGGLRRDGLAETGDSSVAMTLDKDFRRSVVGRAGARITTAIATKGAIFMPYASAFVNRELNDQSSLITPNLHGARFRVEAPALDRTSVRFNAGINAALSSGVALQVDYRHSNAGNFDANAVTGGVSIRW